MSNPDSTAVPSSPGGSSGPSTQVLNPDGSVLGSYILTGTFAARPAPSGGWPIVLVYHGGGESAREILDYSQLGCLEAVVIGLQGQDAYNIPSWMNAFIWLKSSADRGLPRDDVQFTERVLADIARQQPGLPLDRSRIYATGKSDGAGMAVFLAAHPELRSFDLRLRAIAPISGAYFGVHESFAKRSFASPPSGIDYHEIILAPDSIPLLEMHGDADTVMPYEGKRDRDKKAIEHYHDGDSFWGTSPGFDVDEHGDPLAFTANIPGYWQAWAQNVNGVGPEDMTVQPFSASGAPDSCSLYTYSKPGAVPLQFIRVHGGEHEWFGHTGDAASRTIDATTLISNFFEIPLHEYTAPVATPALPIVS